MTNPVKVLVAGLPAEMVREIGQRLSSVVISEFDNAQQMGRAAAKLLLGALGAAPDAPEPAHDLRLVVRGTTGRRTCRR